MYLFSSATAYPQETLLSPFAVFAHKYHNEDFKAAAKDLYEKGYGKRLTAPTVNIKDDITDDEVIVTDNPFPLDIFPEQVEYNINERNRVLGLNADFMACGLLWSTSLIIGNNIKLELKRGWNASANIWIACVADTGVGKSPSIKLFVDPLQKINTNEVKQYAKNRDKFQEWDKLSTKEKELRDEVKMPHNKQFIANDTTLEALVELHSFNPNGVGMFKDELAGWVLDMNKYRDGSDEQFWLSSFDGDSHTSNRKSTGVSHISKPHIPILGGIQPKILTDLAATGNKADSGFMDRILFAYPDIKPTHVKDEDIDQDLIDWVASYVESMHSDMKDKTSYDEEGEVITETYTLTPDAYNSWKAKANAFVDMQNDDKYNQRIKSVLPKMKTYLGRFALICHHLSADKNSNKVSVESMEKAGKLVTYFLNNAIRVLSDRVKTSNIKTVLGSLKAISSTTDKVKAVYKSGLPFTNIELAKEIGVSTKTVSRTLAKIKENE